MADIAIVAIIGTTMAAVILKKVKDYRKGGSGCGCSCSNGCCHCASKDGCNGSGSF